ncbi:putative integral membrane protein [Leishmania donovani]|uniref:Putative integral membrane protein n=1 Tax=Leishmania donovani TaxID=5661 RepID=A0A504XCY6_LEIDO|nr:putative integral membrane protein [Leishmania donovani]
MTSIADGAEETTSAVVDAPAPAPRPLSLLPPPLVSSVDEKPQLQHCSQEAPVAEQQDASLPLPLPASPMTRRRKRPLAATTAAIARALPDSDSRGKGNAAPSAGGRCTSAARTPSSQQQKRPPPSGAARRLATAAKQVSSSVASPYQSLVDAVLDEHERRAQRLAVTGRTEDGPDDSEDGGEAAASALAPLHQQALRLQPLPPVAPASALMQEVSLAGGDDGELAETLADVVAVAPTQARAATQSAAQSALAVERARLLHDSPCTVDERDAAGRMRSLDAEAREGLWRPTTEPRVVARAFDHAGAGAATNHGHASAVSSRAPNRIRTAAALPAAVVEFLKAEADAEAAVKGTAATATGAAERQRRAASPKRSRDIAGARAGASSASPPTTALSTSPPLASFPPVLSPAAESAAVLRDLKDVQRRLHAHGHRRGTAAAAAGATPPEAKAHSPAAASSNSTQGPESCSPCDISVAASARRNRMVGLRRASSEYWATASLTEIVDALDGRCTAAPARGHRKHRRQRGQADFDPASYARRLLETAPRSCTSSTVSDDDDGAYTDGDDAGYDPTGPRPALKREALLRSGPTWATAAAELGLTPTEVQDLLRYSLSSPDAAATWLAVSSRHARDAKRVVAAAVDTVPDDGVGRRHAGRQKKRSSSSVTGGSPSDVHPRRPHRLSSASLDVAAQTALVQRIVAAMPAVPAELQDELSRQRRLLERVCRDVSCMSAPARAAVRARLASPTVSSAAARQPSPLEFSTGASGGGAQTNPSAAAETHNVQVQHEEDQQLLFASLPRPAAHALKAVSGLRGAAADPSRPLPPFHAVVARPTLYAVPQTPAPTTGNDAAAPREPYEVALRELAERETRHYVSELDRLRTMYDRQLQEERRQRQQERRHYAELLQSQQHKMLRHHRETVHLLQRECRLQQQQQESLVQKLAASQAAAAQRQQAQHEQTTKHMLAGAVDVMKSYATAEGLRRGGQAEMEEPAGVAVTSRAMQKHRRQQPRVHFESAASGGSKSKRVVGSPTPSLAAAHSPDDSGTSDAGRTHKATRAEGVTAAATVASAAVNTPPRPSVCLPVVGVASRMSPLDAGIPTAEHLIPPQPASSAAHLGFSSVSSLSASPSRSTLPSPSHPNTDSDGGRAPSARSTMRPSPPAAAPTAVGRRGEQHRTATGTLSVAPSASTLVPTPAANTPAGAAVASAGPPMNTPAMLRAVYGGDAGPPPRQPRTQGRMTLPLHVRLPPEDDMSTRQHLGVAALEAELSDVRAAAAARDAGLAEGTRLYGVVPRRPRLPHAPSSSDTGAVAVERLNQAAPRRALSASPSSAAATRHARTPDGEKAVGRRSAESRRSGSGRGRGGQKGRGRVGKGPRSSAGRRGRRTSPHATVGGGSGDVADRSRRPLLRRFDTEVVSELSSEAGTAPSHARPLHGAWGAPAPNAAASSTAYPSSVAPHGDVMDGRGVVPEPAQYRGMWSEAMRMDDQGAHGGTGPHQEADDAAGVTAGKPSVGRLHVVLSQPAGEVAAVTCATRIAGAAASPVPRIPQAVDAQLRAALYHRAGVVRELRQTASPGLSPVQNDGSTGDTDGRAVLNVAGSLPPCDSAFFGAPAEVLINATDSCAVGDDGDGALPSNLDVAPVPLVMMSDYARAWARYAAAEREVESHAQALAAEDTGVLEAVSIAQERRRRGRGEEDDAVSAVVVATPHPASTAAAVRYREQELGYGDPALRGGSVHVSPRMAAEARALTEARRRLSAIRACFIAPPSLGTASALGNASIGRVTEPDATVRGAALVRELVDTTVLSVLEVQARGAHEDPVQQVMAAMEHEILRLMLVGCLEARVEIASGPAKEENAHPQRTKSQQRRLDAELACALAEAALEDVVHAALERSCHDKKLRQAATTSSSDVTVTATSTMTTTAAPAPPMDASSAAEVDPREHVSVPRTSSTAWLQDDPAPPETAPRQQATPQPKAVGNAEREANAITATATVVLPPPRGDNRDATSPAAPRAAEPTPQEVRVVVDLSPVVRHMITSRIPAAAVPAYDWQQQLHCPPPYPPIQQEQLPSRWMALEDRRDIIVEAESPLVVTETRAELPAPTVADAEMAGEHTSVAVPATDGGGLPSLAVPAPPLPAVVPLPAAASVDSPCAHVEDTATPAGRTTSHDAPQFTLIRLFQSALLDQERLQRASLADREEEQRRAHELLREVLNVAAEQRTSTTPAAAVALPSPSAAAIPTAESQLALSPRPVVNAVADGPRREDIQSTVAVAAPAHCDSRDLCLALHYAATAAQGLTAAARTAARRDAAPLAQAAGHRSLSGPFMRYAAITGDWHSGEQRARVPHRISSGAPLEAARVYQCAPIRKARPVLDTQRDDTSACTATTRYTTGRSSVAFAFADELREGRAVPSGSSGLLPPRASAEVQAAMAAALRAHQQANRAEAWAAAPVDGSRLGATDISQGSAVGNSSYAVSLPARSAQTTAAIGTPPPMAAAAGVPSSSPAKLRAPPPTWSATTREPADARDDGNGGAKDAVDDTWKLIPSGRTRDKVAGTVAVVGPRDAWKQRATQPRSRSPLRTAEWVCVSLTSTSTSSHSNDRGGSGREPNHAHAAQGNGFAPPAISEAAPASSALPFMSARARSATAPARTKGPLPTTAAAVPMPSSPSSRHNRGNLLQAQVLRIQQEQLRQPSPGGTVAPSSPSLPQGTTIAVTASREDRMWHPSAGAAAAGYRDPTTLLAESVSLTVTGSDESDDDYRTSQGLRKAAPGKQAATSRALTGSRRTSSDGERVQRQRELQEHRFFRKRGALDYRHSVVFSPAGCESTGGRGSGGALSSAAVEAVPSPHPRRQRQGTASKSGFAADEPDEHCVPEELRAWYVASNSAVRVAKQAKVRHSSTRAASAEPGDSRAGDEASAPTDALTDRPETPGLADDRNHGEGRVFGDVVVRPSIRSGGAGTTSVNVLQSHAAPRVGGGAHPPEGGWVGAAAGAGKGQTPASATGAQAAASLSSGSGVTPESIRKGSATAAAVTDDANVEPHAWGGRPPLRAHRYVEQPNGLFIDHARHADLLAEYAAEAELRYAQEREDARRARRWARVLYGRSSGARRDGGRRQDETTAVTASANASGTAMARIGCYWLYDAATYRRRFLSTLRYLQRVHVFLGALAAGVSLLALLAITVPFPTPYIGSDGVVGADAGSGASAVLLLALFAHASATPDDTAAAAAAAHVLPVLEQGYPAFALFITLFQVYHASLLLCLCLLLVITGYAPAPWSVAEGCWMAQRRRWLQQEDEDAEHASKWGGEAGKRRRPGGGGEFRNDSIASSDGTVFASASTGAGLGGPRGPSNMARRDAASSSSVLGGGTRHSDQLDDGSRSALFATGTLHHSPDDWLSIRGATHGRQRLDSLRYSVNLGASTGPSGLGATYAAYGATLSSLPGTGGWGTLGEAQHTFPPATMLMSPRGPGGGASRYHPLHRNSEGGNLAFSATTDVPGRHRQQQYWLQGGFTLRGDHPAAAQRGGGAAVSRALGAPPLQLHFPDSTLEGSLSANNVFTRTFDSIERRAMQGLCDALRVLPRVFCVLCARRGDDTIKSSGARRARGGAARGADARPRYVEGGATAAGRELASSLNPQLHHTNPVLPAFLYLHVVLQPRLWCVVVALVLTVVEIALVDERTVELLWLAQPASWWSAAAVPSQRRTSSGDDTSGYLWCVLMAVYATRTAVLWVAFLLNTFF